MSPRDVANRHGIEPVADPVAFQDAAESQSKVIGVLVEHTLGKGAQPSTSAEWYAVALSGYNIVDERCDEYLRTIYKFDREKERIGASLIFADKATGAIMTASNVAPATVQVVSQAFGLGTNFVNAFADSYLYKLRPSSVAGAVKKMRETFRASIEKSMTDPQKSEAQKPIRSAATVFMSIREYRSLCYPETIEARIEEMLAASNGSVKNGKAKGDPKTPPSRVEAATTAAPQVILRTD